MKMLTIAAAQYESVDGDIHTHLAKHLHLALAAAKESVSFLLFPELSLMGYALSNLPNCVISADSTELYALRELSQQTNMTLGLGAAVQSEDPKKPCIATVILQPSGHVIIYKKRFLHDSETCFATAGHEDSSTIEAANRRIALAICADTLREEHAQSAANAGASIYAASVLWSRGGYAVDAALVEQNTRRYNFAALVANHAAPTGGYVSAGQSAFWAPGGKLLCTAPATGSGLLLATWNDRQWSSRWQPLPNNNEHTNA